MDQAGVKDLIASKKLEDRLRAVRLASRLPDAERSASLLLLLSDRANYVAALAAEALGGYADWQSAGEMRERFLWISKDGPKRDPGCHIRSHLAYAFGRLEYTPAHDALYIGLRTVQIEFVAGVPFDTAASLRANCAIAVAHLHDPDAVREIAPLLFDDGSNNIQRIVNPVGIVKRILPEVRIKMAQALGATGDPAAAIPLGIKLRFPEEEAPEVLQECMQSLVLLESEIAVDSISPYLSHPESILAAYAGLMIAQTGAPEAPALLQSAITRLSGDALRAVILALSTLRSDEAREFLRKIAADIRAPARMALVEALQGSRETADLECLRKMADSDGNPGVRKAAAAALEVA